MVAKNKKIIVWLPAIMWMGVIFYLSHQPSDTSSELSSGVTELILRFLSSSIPFDINIENFHFYIRKSAHFTAYMILGILVLFALQPATLKISLVTLVICIFYAISDEFHQLFIPGRSGELRDVFIDSLGACTGIIIYHMGQKIRT